jgi:hypothetical protein
VFPVRYELNLYIVCYLDEIKTLPEGLAGTAWEPSKLPNYVSITFSVKLPSSCSFIVDGLAFCCEYSYYMFRPTWPYSGV